MTLTVEGVEQLSQLFIEAETQSRLHLKTKTTKSTRGNYIINIIYLIMASCCKYRLLINLLSLQSIPIAFSICHNFVHFTLSKAFSKSTKRRPIARCHVPSFFRRAFS